MANKKISELDSRASMSLSDLLAIGDPSTGYLYKTTISDLKTLTGAGVISFNGRYGAVTPAEGDYTLTQLGDVIITSPTNGQVVQYNGSNWVNASLNLTTTLAALTDVAITSIANNQLLKYNSTSGKWENWTPNYLTSYTETDTLATVTARGAVTTGDIAVNGKLTIGANTVGTGQRFEANSSTGNFDLINSSGGGFSFRIIQNGGTAMVVNGSNNVLIGTTTDSGFKLEVNGNVKAGSAGYYGTNGTYNAALIKFNASNIVEIDGSGYGAKASSNFTVAGYNYAIGRVTTDSYVIAKGGSSTPGTAFVSYGIGRPDTTAQTAYLAGFGGVYEGATWANGLGLSFFTSSASDISGGGSITEKMRLKAGGDLMINTLAGTGSRMVVADANGVLSTQAIPSFSLGSLSASAPLSYNNSTGVFSISQASTSTNGYLSSTDWNTFNGKQAALGYTAANDSAVVHISGAETITGAKTFANAVRIDNGSAITYLGFKQYSSGSTGFSGYTSIYANGSDKFCISFGSSNDICFSTASPTSPRTFTFPDADGTVALTNNSSTPTFSSSSNNGFTSTLNLTVPTSSTFSNGGTWTASNNSLLNTWNGSATLNSGATMAGFIAASRHQFGGSGYTVTVNQAGSGIRAIAGFQVLQQTSGTNNGTITHGASMFIQGIYPANTANVTFTNYYGLLINSLDEWGGVTLTNRWGIYQAGSSDKNYFAGQSTFGNNIGWGGVTPSGDGSNSYTLEGAQGAQIAARAGFPQLYISSNVSGTPYAPTRKVAGYATQLYLDALGGTMGFNYAASNSAGTSITWLPALNFNSSGAATFSSTITATGAIKTFRTGASTYLQISAEGGAATFESSNGYYYFNRAVGDYTNPNLMIDGANNRVGIGTSSPVAKLQVAGTNSQIIGYFYNNSNSAGNVPGVVIEAGTNTSDYSLDVRSSTGTSYLKVLGNGDVGIGASGGPTSKLDVRGVIGTTYTSNVSVPNNNTNVQVLNAYSGGDFNTWMSNVFGCTGYNCLISIHWDAGGSAGTCTFSLNKHGGYNGVGIVRLSASTYNADCYTDGNYIYLRSNGYGAFTPSFKVILLARN
jgi:hypothetical protein